MNEDYDIFFKTLLAYCKENSTQILFSGIQHDELTNLKHSKDEQKKFLARLAFRRIELFQHCGILKTSGMKLTASPYAYADPHFIDFFLEVATSSFYLPIFITDDVELRIRLKACLNERAGKKILVYWGMHLTQPTTRCRLCIYGT